LTTTTYVIDIIKTKELQNNLKGTIMTQTTFNSRESYLAYSAEWKANYAQLTIDSRKAKLDFKEAERVVSAFLLKNGNYPTGGYRGYQDSEKNKTYSLNYWAVEALRSTRASLKERACAALIERAESKEEAQRQYLFARDVQPEIDRMNKIHNLA
jgi:hypothetical protein